VFLGNIGIVYIERIEFCRTIIVFYKKQLDTARLIPDEQADGRAPWATRGHRCFDGCSAIFHDLCLKDMVIQIEEMKQNTEHRINEKIGL